MLATAGLSLAGLYCYLQNNSKSSGKQEIITPIKSDDSIDPLEFSKLPAKFNNDLFEVTNINSTLVEILHTFEISNQYIISLTQTEKWNTYDPKTEKYGEIDFKFFDKDGKPMNIKKSEVNVVRTGLDKNKSVVVVARNVVFLINGDRTDCLVGNEIAKIRETASEFDVTYTDDGFQGVILEDSSDNPRSKSIVRTVYKSNEKRKFMDLYRYDSKEMCWKKVKPIIMEGSEGLRLSKNGATCLWKTF
eukprot:UN24469